MKSGHIAPPVPWRYFALLGACAVMLTIALIASGNAAVALVVALGTGALIAEPLFTLRVPDEPPRRPG